MKIIAKENEQFFEEARQRAKEVDSKEIAAAPAPFETELYNFSINDFSEEANGK